MKKWLAVCMVLSSVMFLCGCEGSGNSASVPSIDDIPDEFRNDVDEPETEVIAIADGKLIFSPKSFNHTHTHSADYNCPPDRIGTLTVENTTTWPLEVLIITAHPELDEAEVSVGYDYFTVSAGDTFSVPVVLNCEKSGTFEGDIAVHTTSPNDESGMRSGSIDVRVVIP